MATRSARPDMKSESMKSSRLEILKAARRVLLERRYALAADVAEQNLLSNRRLKRLVRIGRAIRAVDEAIQDETTSSQSAGSGKTLT
jgi:hypothetical protein